MLARHRHVRPAFSQSEVEYRDADAHHALHSLPGRNLRVNKPTHSTRPVRVDPHQQTALARNRFEMWEWQRVEILLESPATYRSVNLGETFRERIELRVVSHLQAPNCFDQ